MALSAGTVSIPVKPDTKGFGALLKGGIEAESVGLKHEGAKIGKVLAAGFVVAAVASVKMAADFQEATTQLVTGAGESDKNIKMVRDGLLTMAPAVGIGPTALAKAMFLVESAGYHGAAGLKVMQAAAEGAKIGGADATVVANGLTTAMTDYKIPVADAAKTTSMLIATVAAGKTNMQDLSSSLSAVLPAAAAAHVGLGQVLGAMGTMTGEGISAQQAAQNLASSIGSLSNPTSVMTKEMAQMGLNSNDVAKNLGTNGLTGTVMTLSEAVLKHMGPSGMVLQSAFNQSKLAAQSAREELAKLPPSLQKLGQGLLNNTVTQKEWMAGLKTQPALTANLGREFATTAKSANGFSDALKSGSGSAQTYNAAMSKMTGGTTGLNTALALSGAHAATFTANVKTISGATTEAGGHVMGWKTTQEDFNTQMASFSALLQSIGVRLGTALLPPLTNAVKTLASMATALAGNRSLLITLAAVLGPIVVAFTAMYVAEKLNTEIMIAQKLAMMAYVVVAGIMGAETEAVVAATYASNAAMIAYSIGTKIAAAGQWLLNAALDANPISLIVIGIAALIAVIVFLATKTQFFQTVWRAMSSFVVTVWNAAVENVKARFALIQAVITTIINVIVGLWTAQWNLIRTVLAIVWAAIVAYVTAYINTVLTIITTVGSAISGAWNALWNGARAVFTNAWNGIKSMAGSLGDAFSAVFSFIAGAASSAFNNVLSTVRGIVNAIISSIDGVIGGINTVASAASAVGVSVPKVPSIPHLAQGGTVPARPGGTLALLGEAGRAETVVDTQGLNGIIRQAGQANGGGFPSTVTLVDSKGQILALLDTRIEKSNNQMMSGLQAGRQNGR